MALFIKKPESGTFVPMYSTEQQAVWLVVGLGNIGEKYVGTRHNLGFFCADLIARDLGASWQEKPSLKCLFAQALHGHCKVLLAKPTTYMNNSGQAVQAIKHFYKLTTPNIIVMHDELDLQFGEIRSRQGGSSAGNNGIKSVSEHIGEDYWRIRVGIGPKSKVGQAEQTESSNFVLSPFTRTQAGKLDKIAECVAKIAYEIIDGQHDPTTVKL